jgi:uncharacterized protein with ParB-like and HNH nuclease domain
MRFADIKKFPRSSYHVDIDFKYVETTLESWNDRSNGSPLILNPEWQRGHVWTEDQQIAWIEYILKGGTTGRDIYFNCSTWMGNYNTPVYCVDGLQRLTAVMAFMNNKIPAFGYLLTQYEDSIRLADARLTFNMLKISNKKELLTIYHNFNAGGTPHSKEEMKRIEKMIEETPEDETL